MVNCQMINSWQTITRGGSVSKAWKPPSSRPILICFEFRSKPSLITVICMDPHSPKKLFATKWIVFWYSEMSFVFLIISLFFVFFLVILCYFVIINFNKKQCYYYHFIDLIFFSWKLLLFFMFADVPACSGMFQNVPCSWFYRRPTDPGRLLTLWVQARALNRYEAFKRERCLLLNLYHSTKLIFKLLIFFPLHLSRLEIYIALLKS